MTAPTRDDVVRGHTQELSQQFSFMSLLAFGFSIMNSWVAFVSLLVTNLALGGPELWLWPRPSSPWGWRNSSRPFRLVVTDYEQITASAVSMYECFLRALNSSGGATFLTAWVTLAYSQNLACACGASTRPATWAARGSSTGTPP
jgi:hypothetical protein